MDKTQSFEQRLERIKEIVALLEKGDLPLEQGVKFFQEGLSLSKKCSTELEQARIIVHNASENNPEEDL